MMEDNEENFNPDILSGFPRVVYNIATNLSEEGRVRLAKNLEEQHPGFPSTKLELMNALERAGVPKGNTVGRETNRIWNFIPKECKK